MKADRKNAIATGICFVAAAATSIIGKLLYAPVLIDPDYLIMGAEYSSQIVWGAVFELILACTAIGTGILMYPYLREFNESLGLGYVIFRSLEVVFILIGTVGVLALLTLSHSYASSVTPDVNSFKTVGTVLKGIHDWTFILGPNFILGVNTFMYSYVFFNSKLLPKPIAMLGMTAAILIFIAALLEMFGVILQVSIAGFLLALPIFAYEMTVAGWLIKKGFNSVAQSS
ncbi:MAG: DUF4386 domain-containing protein [Cytophagales bacterium]|jgi:hypothetical protein|nr:DUF4386 domain-containing protein [Cytophagales bacterium]